MRPRAWIAIAAVAVAAAAGLLLTQLSAWRGAPGQEPIGGVLEPPERATQDATVAALATTTHFHGIAADRSDPSRVYLATHHGLYRVAPDGTAALVSPTRDDFMGFTPHPTGPSVLFASGHPAGGGNLGVVASRDGGVSWEKLADGVGGPVDFHAMDVSKVDPDVIFGVHGGLQRSADGGRSWTRIAPAPAGLIDIAASAVDANRLYAATQNGLRVSDDGGLTWSDGFIAGWTATMVHAGADATVYAFTPGMGLMRADEADLAWQVVANRFGDEVLLHLATGADPRTLYAVSVGPGGGGQAVLVSTDAGVNWARLGE